MEEITDVVEHPSGTVILEACTRDELTQKFNELKASVQDATIMTGAVGLSQDGSTYTLQVDIIKKIK